MKNTEKNILDRAAHGGFTLLELLVVVIIIGILTALAAPSYTAYIMQGKIPQATSNMSILNVQLEQYYQDNVTYAGACADGTVAPLPKDDNFTYKCTLTDTANLVTATGLNSMKDFTYTIDQAGNKSTTSLPTGWGTVPATCWIVKRGSTC